MGELTVVANVMIHSTLPATNLPATESVAFVQPSSYCHSRGQRIKFLLR
jgi:hypothetical protein